MLGRFHHMCDQFLIFWITASKGTSWSQPWYGTLQFESTRDFLPHCEERLYQIEPQAFLIKVVALCFFTGHSIVIWLPMADPGQVGSSFYYWHPTSGKENWICWNLILSSCFSETFVIKSDAGLDHTTAAGNSDDVVLASSGDLWERPRDCEFYQHSAIHTGRWATKKGC